MKRRSLIAVREEPKQCNSDFVIYAMVTATAVLSYVNSLNGDFVHDDIPAVVTNGDVTGTNSLKQLFLDDFWGTPMGDANSHKSYRPLTTLSFRFGRLPSFTATIVIITISGILMIKMPTLASLLILRWVQGVGMGGSIVTTFVLLVEYCGVKAREPITALFHLPINFGHMTLPWVSYFFRDCDDFVLCISLVLFIWIFMPMVMHESPKWLMDTGKMERCYKVVDKMCKFNKESPDELKAAIKNFRQTRMKEKEQFWHIFRSRQMTINFLCMIVVYFTCGMGYYGVSQYIGNISSIVHVNVSISGAMTVISTLISTLLIRIMSRKMFLMGTNFLAGACMLIIVVLPVDIGWPRVFLACLCNCFYFSTFVVVFLCGVEMFPTSIRNAVLGILAVCGRLGMISSPFINYLGHPGNGIVFGILPIIGGLLIIPVPETKNVPLPTTIASLKDAKKNEKA